MITRDIKEVSQKALGKLVISGLLFLFMLSMLAPGCRETENSQAMAYQGQVIASCVDPISPCEPLIKEIFFQLEEEVIDVPV
ncbi:hypothetical protein N7E81_13130 [Reichenbachiella carrageenanivorans]|uniref:Uncharacterized protein n=1 Tax=Reichenbachiella carrageenanivorans TaxID=2979869 RepID=A0ABY6CWK5_9BACT|nr:hypothetical protein [Reichenbachiella carrageenanivorans]UXX78299.1 hypothetical protein N7E81_13130 [Reichenbachiella carrageenanivorans]